MSFPGRSPLRSSHNGLTLCYPSVPMLLYLTWSRNRSAGESARAINPPDRLVPARARPGRKVLSGPSHSQSVGPIDRSSSIDPGLSETPVQSPHATGTQAVCREPDFDFRYFLKMNRGAYRSNSSLLQSTGPDPQSNRLVSDGLPAPQG